MRRMFYAVLLAGLFLLLLSPLVVVPEAPAVPPAAHSSSDLHAVFRPLVSAILPDAALATDQQPQKREPISLLLLFCLYSAPLSLVRDANGRVLNARRYENSVYQLFRPETAGG